MEIGKTLSDDAVSKILGERISKYRLNKNLTQAQLSEEAGVSLSTLSRMEAGHPSQTTNLIRVLRALNLMENIELLIPEPPASPIQQAKLDGKIRKRARKPQQNQMTTKKHSNSWTWALPKGKSEAKAQIIKKSDSQDNIKTKRKT